MNDGRVDRRRKGDHTIDEPREFLGQVATAHHGQHRTVALDDDLVHRAEPARDRGLAEQRSDLLRASRGDEEIASVLWP